MRSGPIFSRLIDIFENLNEILADVVDETGQAVNLVEICQDAAGDLYVEISRLEEL